MKYAKQGGLWLPKYLRNNRGLVAPGMMPVSGPQGAAPAPPSTNLTFWMDGSDLSTLWKTNTQGNNPCWSVQASADDDIIEAIQSLYPGPTSEYTVSNGGNVFTAVPKVKMTTPLLGTQCLDFDGSDDVTQISNRTSDALIAASSLFTTTARTIILSVRFDTFQGSDGYRVIMAHASSSVNWGVYQFRIGGVNSIGANNNDGGYDTVTINAAIDTNYVVMCRHDGSNLYISLNGGAESSVASGALSSGIADSVAIGGNPSESGHFLDGRIGEIAVWNVDLSGQGTDLADAITYFTDKWI